MALTQLPFIVETNQPALFSKRSCLPLLLLSCKSLTETVNISMEKQQLIQHDVEVWVVEAVPEEQDDIAKETVSYLRDMWIVSWTCSIASVT